MTTSRSKTPFVVRPRIQNCHGEAAITANLFGRLDEREQDHLVRMEERLRMLRGGPGILPFRILIHKVVLMVLKSREIEDRLF